MLADLNDIIQMRVKKDTNYLDKNITRGKYRSPDDYLRKSKVSKLGRDASEGNRMTSLTNLKAQPILSRVSSERDTATQ